MAKFDARLEDHFDEELNRAIRFLDAATPPAGMESRVLERAEAYAASLPKPTGMRWLSLTRPLGTLAVVAIIAVAVHHRSEIAHDRVQVEEATAPVPLPAAQIPAPQVRERTERSSQPVIAAPVRTRLPVEVLGGPPTREELLLMQMSAQTEQHPELKEILDPEMRNRDLAQAKQDFQDFLNSGSKTGEETP